MLKVQLICTGKLKERFYLEACAEYAKRLSPHCKLTITELPEHRLPQQPSQAQIAQALEREGRAMLERVPAHTLLIALCVEGRGYTSEEFSALFSRIKSEGSSSLTFVIGGSYGLPPCVKQAAAHRLSMSQMTFPHHLARVMLLEQIYRAFQLESGSSYHK